MSDPEPMATDRVASGRQALAPALQTRRISPMTSPIGVRRSSKRIIDVVIASVLLAALSPLLLVVAIAVKLDSPGPLLFAHRRLGQHGRFFDCLKFRSMRIDAERLLRDDETLQDWYVRNHFKIPTHLDRRVTRLGRFLRLTSLDELPQLWNVIRGDMSLVGPRPIVESEGAHYGDRLQELLSIRPGLSGAWAVQGRSRVGYPHRVEIELAYLRTWSLRKDFGILIRTPWVVLTQRGCM